MAVVEIHRHRFTVEERLLRRGNEIRSGSVAGLRLSADEVFGARS